MITRHIITEPEPRDLNLIQQAEAAIAVFEQVITPGAWTYLDKRTLITEIRDRVRNPYLIDQGGQPFCGPASVLFELARKHPLRYVELCRHLYIIGGFHSASTYIAASDRLLKVSQGNLRMSQVDWMLLSTFREMENILFPVEPNAPDLIRNLAGMTKSWEMKGWVREILRYKHVDYHHAFLTNDMQAIHQASEVVQQGGVAFALITAEGLLTDNPPRIPLPTHWVSFLGNLSMQAIEIEFDIYTWSKKIHLQVDIPSFKKYLWATVTGLP